MTAVLGGVIALYAAVSVLLWRARGSGEAPSRWVRPLVVAGVVLHVCTLGWQALVAHALPGFAESLSGVALGVMIAVAWVATGELAALAAFLAPAATLLLVLSLGVPASWRVAALSTVGSSAWLPVHVSLVLAAVAGFVVELVVGVVLEGVRRRLKTKRLADLSRLPPLDTLETIQRRALLFGVTCLGSGVVAGALWAAGTMHHQEWIAHPKVTFSVITWVWYSGLAVSRAFGRLRSRASLVLSVLGFVLLVFSLVGLDFLTGGFHARGG